MLSLADITEKVKKRFWAKVRKTDGCWEWDGGRLTTKLPYGRLAIGKGTYGAHRVSYMIHFGEIPSNLLVCHHCDCYFCVRPDHLFLGTQKDNLQDASAKGRMATGNRNGSRTHPERLARGNRHPARLHPERMPRGDRSGSRLHPEKMPRGEKHVNAILTEADVAIIRQLSRDGIVNCMHLGGRFGVTSACIRAVINRRSWKHCA